MNERTTGRPAPGTTGGPDPETTQRSGPETAGRPDPGTAGRPAPETTRGFGPETAGRPGSKTTGRPGSEIAGRPGSGEDAHAAMRLLREEVGNLVKTVPGPVAAISLRLGECALEVTWAFPQHTAQHTAQPHAAQPTAQPTPQPPWPVVAVGQAATERAPTGEPAARPAETSPLGAAREHPSPHAVTAHAVTAPLVGTFYVAAEPGAPPFVQPGDRVDAGQTIGIVEAMKLMNPVVAGHAGEVVEVVAGNGEPVEYGQVLVRLRTDDA
ncbi:biotin/lipoyl-containing protein [Streptosporangium sp. NPDC002524]|uniref:acetyl-CoA carboxylase biotin carboxyl carrier protein n=1 Tax=Streptosporangium sp. NPDC002524 TaxID=3154537 RepID=UPI00331FA238